MTNTVPAKSQFARSVYRALVPYDVRCAVRKPFPYIQNMLRTASFWTTSERGRRKAELMGCDTPEACFTFATDYMGLQQFKPEILGFLNFAKAHRPVRICELGLLHGGNNIMLTHALPDVAEIIGVDLYIRNKSQLRYYAKPSQRQTFVEGRTCDKATLEAVTGALRGEKLDLLFIDADHGYAGVRQDFMHYRHFVREGGIIAFHDIVQDHLTRFGRDPATFLGARSGEVHLFWKRLKPYYDTTKEFVVDYEQDGYGIGALIYSSKVDVPESL